MERKTGATSSSSESPYMKSPRKPWRPPRSPSRRLPRGDSSPNSEMKGGDPLRCHRGVGTCALAGCKQTDAPPVATGEGRLVGRNTRGEPCAGRGQAFSDVYCRFAEGLGCYFFIDWAFSLFGCNYLSISWVFVQIFTGMYITCMIRMYWPYLQLFSKLTLSYFKDVI